VWVERLVRQLEYRNGPLVAPWEALIVVEVVKEVADSMGP
jgi:hypothetical protein